MYCRPSSIFFIVFFPASAVAVAAYFAFDATAADAEDAADFTVSADEAAASFALAMTPLDEAAASFALATNPLDEAAAFDLAMAALLTTEFPRLLSIKLYGDFFTFLISQDAKCEFVLHDKK